jgi:hypothetical protein
MEGDGRTPVDDGETMLDESFVIGLLIRFVKAAPPVKDMEETDEDVENVEKDDAVSAGKMLWDLSASASYATLLLGAGVAKACCFVLGRECPTDRSLRLAEISIGTITNLMSSIASEAKTATNTVLEDQQLPWVLTGVLMTASDSRVLIQVFRAFATAIPLASRSTSWTAPLLDPQVLCHTAWMLENSLDSALVSELCRMLVNLAHSATEIHPNAMVAAGAYTVATTGFPLPVLAHSTASTWDTRGITARSLITVHSLRAH